MQLNLDIVTRRRYLLTAKLSFMFGKAHWRSMDKGSSASQLPEMIPLSVPSFACRLPRFFDLICRGDRDGGVVIDSPLREAQDCISILLIGYRTFKIVRTERKEARFRSSFLSGSLGTVEYQRRACQGAKRWRNGLNMLTLTNV